jgi:phosphotransferase system HPr-like phosphotransfer protein
MLEMLNVDVCTISLAKIKDVTRFVQIMNQQEGKYILQHDNAKVEAKSIMGIFSLNLEKDLLLIAQKANYSEIEQLKKALKEANLLKN